jgi:hypothetical protein
MPAVARILSAVLLLALAARGIAADDDPKLDPKLKALATRLKDRTLAGRVKAVEEIARLGDDAAPLAKDLCEATLDPSPQMAEAALGALASVRPDLASPLASLAEAKSLSGQLEGLDALGGLGDKGAPVLPVLRSHIKKYEAGEQTTAAVRAHLLQACLEALGRITGPSDEAIKELTGCAAPGKNAVTRNAAVRALGTLADKREDLQKQFAPVVVEALKEPKVVLSAIEASGHLGGQAKDALDALDGLKSDKSDEVRVAAVAMLAKIQGTPEPPENVDARASLRGRAALEWIAKSQQRDGSWSTGMGANAPATVVTTSFCALALMTDDKHYKAEIDKAAGFVLDNLFVSGGPVKLPPEWDQSNWTVAVGGFFICEYFAAQKKDNPNFKSAKLQQAVDKLVEEAFKRMETSGGWGHTPRVKNPLGYVELEIVSVWMLAALGSAEKLGEKVPDKGMEKALQFIEDCCNPDKGEVGYSSRDGQRGFGFPYRTGGTIFAFASIGRREHPLFPKMVASWKASMDASDDGHGSVALGMLGSALGAKAIGADEWQDFKKKFYPEIMEDGAFDGSFRPLPGKTLMSKGGADKMLGPSYNTAIYALILRLDDSGLTVLAPPKKK